MSSPRISALAGSLSLRSPGLPAAVLRGLLLVGCAALLIFGDRPSSEIGWVLALAAAAGFSTAMERFGIAGLPARVLEVVVWAVAVQETGYSNSPLLPYLLGPVFAGGLVAGAIGTTITAGAAAACLLVALSLPAPGRDTLDYTTAAAQWTVIALLGGLVAAWAGRLRETASGATTHAYAEAHGLLSQLYTVTRALPGSLDPVTTADALLDELAEIADYSAAVVLVTGGGDRLVPLTHRGPGSADWETTIAGSGPFARSWADAVPLVRAGSFTGRPDPLLESPQGTILVAPIGTGSRLTGLVGLQSPEDGAYPDAVVARVSEATLACSLRLDTGLLFDRIREMATAEERRRLAREIHDGIAQELASLGYVVDDLTASATEAGAVDLAESIGGLREQMTRIVRELRLSIFELRSEAARHSSLGAALSDFLRTIGAGSQFTVHLTVDEATRRLPTNTEAELLRITQEAINNARKHSEADNLWVTCRVHPPTATLIVEDDGRGLGAQQRRADSFGMDSMRERAERVAATVQVRDRQPRGTYVAVTVGAAGSPGPTGIHDTNTGLIPPSSTGRELGGEQRQEERTR